MGEGRLGSFAFDYNLARHADNHSVILAQLLALRADTQAMPQPHED